MKLTNILAVLLLMLSTFIFSACNKSENANSDSFNNSNSDTSVWEEEMVTSSILSVNSETSKDIVNVNKGKTKAEFLFTEDGLNLQIVANKAAIAYLRNDKEELLQYLADTNYDALPDNANNIFNQLQYMALKLPDSTTTVESDGIYTIVYQIVINKGTESNTVKIGDVVDYTGNMQYGSSTAAKPGKAKITGIAKGAKHPYHVIHTDNKSNVYGWVDAADITSATASGKKSIEEIASEVIAGKWGNGSERKNRLEEAGYNYSEVQRKVNELPR